MCFAVDPKHFTITMYHGGRFSDNFYVGGDMTYFDYVDKDMMSMVKIGGFIVSGTIGMEEAQNEEAREHAQNEDEHAQDAAKVHVEVVANEQAPNVTNEQA
ncbi:hypothetical protein ACE6H2_026615 [Prunus campanulata]